jgi:hypothetical protein
MARTDRSIWSWIHVLVIVAHIGMIITGIIAFVSSSMKAMNSEPTWQSDGFAQSQDVVLPWATDGVVRPVTNQPQIGKTNALIGNIWDSCQRLIVCCPILYPEKAQRYRAESLSENADCVRSRLAIQRVALRCRSWTCRGIGYQRER